MAVVEEESSSTVNEGAALGIMLGSRKSMRPSFMGRGLICFVGSGVGTKEEGDDALGSIMMLSRKSMRPSFLGSWPPF